ncbi:MAG: nucleotidyltransferase domain-containing protein [Chromatiales bacterium]|nr:MAG: nucleotidyltransferase domain-containing protein [Chromatiales bacterium]
MQLRTFLNDLSAWSESRSDVLGLALVGSHARGAARPCSDVDVIVLCEDPLKLADSDGWIARFGDPLKKMTETYGVVRVVRVFYGGGLEVEFGLSPVDWADVPLDAGTRRVISEGMRILYDPKGLLRSAEIAAAA